MRDDQYDDGLVHSHGWAREPSPRILTNRPAPQPVIEDAFDDGLVHSHDWARNG